VRGDNDSFREGDAEDENDATKLLLVANYRSNANAYPGNEWWFGPEKNKKISGINALVSALASVSAAASSCSQIFELHNPDVNHHMSGHFASVVHGSRLEFLMPLESNKSDTNK